MSDQLVWLLGLISSGVCLLVWVWAIKDHKGLMDVLIEYYGKQDD